MARHSLSGVVQVDPRADARLLLVDGQLWRRRAAPAPGGQVAPGQPGR